jgi:predicted transporter
VFRPSFIGIIYIVIGVAIAASNDYFERLNTLRQVLSALLAIALWPLVLLGIDLHIKK